jgi:[acyl-carrier-protein] S-malonyltransferase
MHEKLAFVFPGQGSQFVGMLADIAARYSEVEATYAEASAILGYDLWQLVQQGPSEKLDQTVYTQPALLTASIAIWRIIQATTPCTPSFLAGHSLGEYTALVCAKSLSFHDAVKLVEARARFMQEAVPSGIGAMAAIIGLEEDKIASICEQVSESGNEVVSPANFNSIGQIVVAGHRAAVEGVILLAKQAGAKMVMMLPVSVPSHCILMKPAAERLAHQLSEMTINSPVIPVISNVNAQIYQNTQAIYEGLYKQLFMPVRWVESIQTMVKAGVKELVECGPGKVLTGLNKRIDKSLQLLITDNLSHLESLLKFDCERSELS